VLLVTFSQYGPNKLQLAFC